jgi:hypothetical protein
LPRDRHPQKDIEKELKRAEDHDWKVRQKEPKKSHKWGDLISPDGEVTVRVDGTPRNPTEAAKRIRRAVDKYERNESS